MNPPYAPDLTPLVEALSVSPPSFRTSEDARSGLRAACAAHPDVASYEVIGRSEEGRPLDGIVLGRGPHTVSLVAGNHSDEPVGPETLRHLVVESLRRRDALDGLFEAFRFVVVPHTNPDGEARNQGWIARWPDLPAYLAGAFREPPGRDLEFGFPAMRAENRAVSAFLRRYAPFGLHMSLHGMGFAEGAMLLIERRWGYRTGALQEAFREAAAGAGLGLHDHNRKGEKGFFYLGPGFCTTPEGEAMRGFFHAQGDDETAGLFHDSSMEFVRSLGGDPLCLVTELPLFVLAPRDDAAPGDPSAYLAFREVLPELRLAAAAGRDLDLGRHGFTPSHVPLAVAMGVQLLTLEAALRGLQG